MQTYSTYLERVFALPFEDASRIFTTIKEQIENDERLQHGLEVAAKELREAAGFSF